MDVCDDLEHGSLQSVFGRLCDAQEKIPFDSTEKYETAIRKVTAGMMDRSENPSDGPADAGIAFLGQFIDHDITLEATTELGKPSKVPVEKLRNFRTPKLDLDCVYGDGPEVHPHLYDQTSSGKLLFGRMSGEGMTEINQHDLARNRHGRALIGDPRNDENVFVSQVHGRQFVQAHNLLVDQLGSYEAARETLTKSYHHRIVTEFLPAVVHRDTLKPFLDWYYHDITPKTGDIDWAHAPDMPIEFAAAAFRFGHSMIRQDYALNDPNVAFPIFNGDLRGFSPVAAKHNLDMELFFGPHSQKSRPIDTQLPAALHELPKEVVGATGEPNLAFRNIIRGQLTFHLPYGEDMANLMGTQVIDTHDLIKDNDLKGMTPLWFYILAEAEKLGGKLGPVGGGIVAGTLVNLLRKSTVEENHEDALVA
ncbi:hypothetical protein TW80_15250 [Loktanella sp. S4079]|nr:hypothetical protein TW80_15250 [Loktanella sp. S4079]